MSSYKAVAAAAQRADKQLATLKEVAKLKVEQVRLTQQQKPQPVRRQETSRTRT